MNPAIVKAILGKNEQKAVEILEQFQRSWRIHSRDDEVYQNLLGDRNDNRYNLVIKNETVARVLFG